MPSKPLIPLDRVKIKPYVHKRSVEIDCENRGKFIGDDFSFAPAFCRRRNNGTTIGHLYKNHPRKIEGEKFKWYAARRINSLKSQTNIQGFLYGNSRDSKEEKELEYEMAEVVKAQNITKEMIVEEIATIAFCKEEEEGKKIHPAVRLKALDMLAKWAGLYEKDNAQKLAGTSLLQIAFVGADKVDIKSAQLNKVEGTQISEAPSPKLAALEDDISKKLKDKAAHLLKESDAD